MSHEHNQSVTRIFMGALKSIVKEFFKICAIAIAWCMRLCGMALTKTGEAIERIIVKRNSTL